MNVSSGATLSSVVSGADSSVSSCGGIMSDSAGGSVFVGGGGICPVLCPPPVAPPKRPCPPENTSVILRIIMTEKKIHTHFMVAFARLSKRNDIL